MIYHSYVTVYQRVDTLQDWVQYPIIINHAEYPIMFIFIDPLESKHEWYRIGIQFSWLNSELFMVDIPDITVVDGLSILGIHW